MVLALSFKLNTLADELGDDLDGLSVTFREQFEANTTTYSILMIVAILGDVLLFVLMAPFEFTRIWRQVTHPQPDSHWQLWLQRHPLPLTLSWCRLNVRMLRSPSSSAR